MSEYRVVQEVELTASPTMLWVADSEDCRAIADMVAKLAGSGMSAVEIEEDVMELFDFLDDCVITGNEILVSVIQQDTGAVEAIRVQRLGKSTGDGHWACPH